MTRTEPAVPAGAEQDAGQAARRMNLLHVPGGAAALGAFRADLNEELWAWQQDPAVLGGVGRQTLPSMIERDGHTQDTAQDTLNNLHFTVYAMGGQKPRAAGSAGVNVDWRRRTGMFYIYLAAEARGRGVGTEAARLVLDFAFHLSHLDCVWLSVYAPNTRAIHSYEKAGFRRIGVRRRSGYWLGERVDEVLMDAVREEFVGVSAVRRAMSGADDGAQDGAERGAEHVPDV